MRIGSTYSFANMLIKNAQLYRVLCIWPPVSWGVEPCEAELIPLFPLNLIPHFSLRFPRPSHSLQLLSPLPGHEAPSLYFLPRHSKSILRITYIFLFSGRPPLPPLSYPGLLYLMNCPPHNCLHPALRCLILITFRE